MSLIVDVLQYGTNSHPTSSEAINALATDILSDGVIGSIANTSLGAPMTGAFAINAQGTPNTTVAVTAGVAYVTGTPDSQGSQRVRVKLTANTNVTISANSSGSVRYDWLYIKLDPTAMADPAIAADDVASLYVSRSTSSTADDGTPPSFGLVLGVITVSNGFFTIINSNIADKRVGAGIVQNSVSLGTDGWTSGLTVPNTVVYNGNRSYTLTVNGKDLTGLVSPGMRLKATRTVTAPTQCASLNGTNQYFSKSSPAGMTFTDDFVVSAWIKLSSYAAADIVSRFNGTSGWRLDLSASGQVELVGWNASGSNNSSVVSYQSVPLNKWVHIAAQLDMSTFTATTTTSYIMIDGVDVPASVNRAGTNPTALIQAGNLEIGSSNGGTRPFPGKVAQAAVYSAKVTQTTMQGYVSQGISGTETSLISAYSFNNSITDLTSNGNDLIANGSALATNTDSPFAGGSNASVAYTAGTTEYAEVINISFSTNTTITVMTADGYAIPTSGGVSAAAYSTQSAPLGSPDKINQFGYVQVSTSATATSLAAVNGLSYTVPTRPGQRLKLTFYTRALYNTTGGVNGRASIWDGPVSSGVQLQDGNGMLNSAGTSNGNIVVYITSNATSKTFNIGLYNNGSGTATVEGTATAPMFLAIDRA